MFLSFFGNIASIIGLLITIVILKNVDTIKKGYLMKARLPAIINRLEKIRKECNSLFDDIPGNQEPIIAAFKRIKSILQNLEKKLDGDERRRTKKLINEIKKYDRPISNNFAWDIVQNTDAIIELLKQHQKDKKWGH